MNHLLLLLTMHAHAHNYNRIPGRGACKLPITDVTIFFDGSESAPPGFEPIKESVSGQSANLNSGKWFANSMTLCFTRKEKLCEHEGQPCRAVVEDIVVINTGRGETLPEGYEMVKTSQKGVKLDLNAGMRISTANAAFIALKHVRAFPFIAMLWFVMLFQPAAELV